MTISDVAARMMPTIDGSGSCPVVSDRSGLESDVSGEAEERKDIGRGREVDCHKMMSPEET